MHRRHQRAKTRLFAAALAASILATTPAPAFASDTLGTTADGPRVPLPAPLDDKRYEPTGQDGDGFTAMNGTTASGLAATAKLGTQDTKVLQQAQAEEEPSVTVMLLASPGNTRTVEELVAAAGGSVGEVQRKLGYVRATVPTRSVQKLAASSSVKAIDLNKTFQVPKPDLGVDDAAGPAATADSPTAPDATTPATNPYLPINDTGAVDFVTEHPEWDGRGVTVGVLDTGVDLDHEALQTTSDGRPKVVDWITATDPLVDGDGTWVRMQYERSGPSFSFLGQTWTAPAGTFQLGLFYEMSTTNSDFGGDLNGDGDTQDRFGVLYDRSTHRTWVDADGDYDFTDADPMKPFAEGRQVAHFGTDDPQTEVSETFPFVVEHRDDVDLSPLGGSSVGKTDDYISIGLPSGAHGTHVAGIVAGTSLFKGEMHGAAPGAQIVSARACSAGGGCTEVALTEGMIDLVTNRGVDVVNLSIGGLPALNDGSDVITKLYDTLIAEYGVQIIVAAGNDGSGTNTVSSPAVSSSVLAVAASVSDETWWANYGARVGTAQGIFGFSSRGPSEGGALAPAVSAPGSAISTTPTWVPGTAVPEAGYSLPHGYGMFNGTSMAAPQVAGDTALLLSAAKADGIEAGPTALRTALTGTAVQIPGVPTTAQGTGLVHVPAAWAQLSKGVRVNDYTVSAPVCSSLSPHLATPNTGAGVYNRCLPGKGGQVVGADKTYQVSVTRKSGPSGSSLHQIGWIGNDGTFSARTALPLRLGSRGTVTVTAEATSAGVHSAIMTIDDPATVGVDRFVPVTVMATQGLTAPDHRVTRTGTVARGGTTSFLVPVPAGVEALQLELGGLADGSQVRVLPIDPDGMPADSTASNHCYTGYPDPAGCEATERAVQRPKPGVWEFVVEARRTSGTAENPFTAQVSLQGMSFSPEDTTIESASLHQPVSADVTGTNTWGALKAHAIDGELGFVRNLFSTVANGQLTANRVDVPRQSTRLDVTLTSRAKDADLDMYVVGRNGIAATSMNIGAGTERIVLDDPAPGTYYVVVTGANVPTSPVTFDYHEEVFSKGIGTISPKSDAEQALQPGEAMPVAADISLSQVPLSSEPVIGRVRVANEFGTVVGAAAVRISDVVAPKLDVKKWEKPFVGAKLTNSGVVAGDRQFNSRTVPTTWTASGGFKDLEKGAAQSGSALDINEGLEAAGYLSYSGKPRPAVWAADGTVTDLGLPDWRPQPYASAYATGIDEQGTVVGFAEVQYRDETGGHTYVDPFTWTAAGGFAKLDHLSDNPTQTQARAVSPSGLAVGSSLTSEGAPRAVTWDTASGRVTDLGTLPGQGGSTALGVNAEGTVVGVSGDDAFVWTPEGMERLPDFGFNAVAEKITSDGWILGSVELRPDLEVSAMWDPQGRIWDLSAMVPDDIWFNPTYAFGINDAHDLMLYGEGGPAGASSSTALLHIPDDMVTD